MPCLPNLLDKVGVLLLLNGLVAVASALPLLPTRSIDFETQQGTWLSVDVSPRGDSIVFDLLGDLYVMPVSGGRARNITTGMAFNAQPRYSPDGQNLAFTSDRDGWVNVWISDVEGRSARQLTHFRWLDGPFVESPVWTPDGRGIILTERLREHGQRLVEYPIDGGLPKAVTHLGSRKPAWPDLDDLPDDWKSDVSYRGAAFGHDPNIVYAAMQPGGRAGAFWQIVRINRDTHRSTYVTTPQSGMSAMRPILSPNGRYLVYGAGTGLRVRNLVTDDEKWLIQQSQRASTSIPDMTFDGRDLLPGSSFTPDSRALVTAFKGKIWRIEIETDEVSEIPFTAHVNKKLGSLVRFEYPISDEPFTARAIQHPQLSPDGLRCAFTALDRVWVVTLDSGAPRRLTEGSVGEFFPTWSPDGKSIVFASWSDDDGGALYRAPADGRGTPVLLTHDSSYYSMPVYSADGNEILAVRGSRSGFRSAAERSSWLGDAKLGLELVRVGSTAGASEFTVPTVAPWKPVVYEYKRPHTVAGNRVYVYDPDEGLVSFRPNGTDRRVIAKSIGTAEHKATQVLLAPSGKYGLALIPGSQRAYLFAVPDSAAEPWSLSLTDETGRPHAGRSWLLSQTGVSYLGWTADNRPYFSTGSELFVAIQSPPAPADFRRVHIDLRIPRDRPIGSLLLRDARLLTMNEHEIIEHGDLLIRDGRIVALGPTGSLAVPAGTKILDERGMTVIPGYVDVHDHVAYSVSFGVHSRESPRLLVELAYGVTTLRDPFGRGVDLMAYGERAAAGDLVSPRIYSINANVSSASFGDGATQDLAETRNVLRYWSDDYHTETIKQYQSGGRRTRQLVAMAALEQGLSPTNEGARDMAMQLTMVLDGYGGIEHNFPIVPVFDDVTQLLVRSGTILTPTLGVYLGWQSFLNHEDLRAEHKLQRFYTPDSLAYAAGRVMDRESNWVDAETVREYSGVAANIVEAGGCVALGSHGNVPGMGVHIELAYLRRGGMSAYDVLRVGTLCGARAIGHEQDFGSLAPGKLADLQILDKNPLEDINNTRSLRYVMKGGRLYDAGSLDELWPRSRSLRQER